MKIKDTLLSTALLLLLTATVSAQSWTQVATDIDMDGANPDLLDGKALSYYYDNAKDMLFFKIDVANMTAAQTKALGVNIMFNIQGSSDPTFNFWGMDNKSAYHKLLTVWVTGNPPSSYSGTVGIANAAGVNSKVYSNLYTSDIAMDVQQNNNVILIGVPRHHIIPEQEMMNASTVTMKVAAAVGSNQYWNDDIYNPSASMTITPNVTSVKTITTAADISLNVYPNPVNDVATVSYQLKTASTVTIEVTDITGKVVSTINEEQQAGEYNNAIDMHELKQGVYFVRVLINNTPCEAVKLMKVG